MESIILWLTTHFKHTKNKDICLKFGISEATLHRIARKHGLKKSRQFMQKIQTAASQAAVKAIHSESSELKKKRREIAIRNSMKGRFKKGVYALKNKSPEELEAMRRKQAETRKKSLKTDIARICLGLEQIKKFRLPKDFNPKRQRQLISIRYGLRKKGYLIPQKGGMAVYYNDATSRNEIMEKNANKLGLIIKEYGH